MENILTIKELEQVVRWGFNGEVRYPIVHKKEEDKIINFNGRVIQGSVGGYKFSFDPIRFKKPYIKGFDKKYKTGDVMSFIYEHINVLVKKNAVTLKVLSDIEKYIDLLCGKSVLTAGECYMLKNKHNLIAVKDTEVLMVANGDYECAIDCIDNEEEENICEENDITAYKNTEVLKDIYDTNFNVMSIAHAIRKAEKRNVSYKEAMSRALKMAHALCKEAADFETICRDFNFEVSANVEVVVPKKVKNKVEETTVKQTDKNEDNKNSEDNEDKPKVKYILSYDEHNFYINRKVFQSGFNTQKETEKFIKEYFLSIAAQLKGNFILEHHRKAFEKSLIVAKMNKEEMAERNIVLKYVGELEVI